MKSEKYNLEELSAFLKEKGFIFPSSEIYGGLAGIYDYGHYGYLLMKNIKDAWMKSILQNRYEIVALDSAIFMHRTAWKASGHIDGFNDPQIDCRKCKSRIRADHLLEEYNINADKMPIEDINRELDKLRADKRLICPNCESSDLTEARVFSLMVKSNLGSPVDEMTSENVMYLRPETCGGIYLQYKNTLDSLHLKLPFGIAQIGKAFRNEIVAKQFVFRTREFEQMEMQFFFDPLRGSSREGMTDDEIIIRDVTDRWFEYWQQTRWEFYNRYGIESDRLNWHKHDKLAHYASQAFDIEYNYKCLGGYKELEGVHARGDWDLSQHSKFSGKDLSYFDEESKRRFVPHIIETSVGVARMMLAFIDNAYNKEIITKNNSDGSQTQDERVVLKLHYSLSPIKIAVLPLFKKDGMSDKAREIYNSIRQTYQAEYDESGSIGKRYRRQDEIGTPFCVTIDYDTMSDNMITIRNRDTMTQDKINIKDLENYLKEKLGF